MLNSAVDLKGNDKVGHDGFKDISSPWTAVSKS